MTITHTGDTDAPNEILAAAKEAKEQAAALPPKAKGWPLATIGIAAGIGSAAVAAAVLYANRGSKRK